MANMSEAKTEPDVFSAAVNLGFRFSVNAVPNDAGKKSPNQPLNQIKPFSHIQTMNVNVSISRQVKTGAAFF